MAKALNETSGDKVMVNHYQNGKLFSAEQVTEENWQEVQRNYLRARIASLVGFGFVVTVEKAELAACPNTGFLQKSLIAANCLKVLFSGENKLGMKTLQELILQSAKLAIGQVISAKQIESGLVNRKQIFEIEQVILNPFGNLCNLPNTCSVLSLTRERSICRRLIKLGPPGDFAE